MTGLDVWRIVVDLFTFGWVPTWTWIGLGILTVSCAVGLFVGPVLRARQPGR